MLAVVEMPRTQSTEAFRLTAEGNVPKSVIEFLESEFPGLVKIQDDNVPAEDLAWYKAAKERSSPAKTLRILRTASGKTQTEIANALGINKQNLCAMEKGRRPITLQMAHKLAKALGTSYKMFAED